MAVSQLPQAPYRQDRKVFPTPIVGDVLFSEVRDCTRIEIPEYGTPHPNSKKWPDHKLVFVKTVDIERDGIFEFFYAADRKDQDLYNFSFGLQGIGPARQFRTVQRSYVTLRDDFQPLDIPFGTPMPNVPEDKFDGVEYVFFDRQQQRINQQELDSLYVAEIHTYVEKAFLDYKLSYGTQKSDLTPEKFRAAIPQISTEQIVEGLAEQPVLTGSQLSVTEDQLNPDVKLVKVVSREAPATDVELIGQRAYVEGGPIADVVETYSKEPIEVDADVHVVQSTVTPLGDGSFVRETVKVDSWPELKSSEWDPLLNTQVVRTEQFVVPPTSFDEENTSFRAVNEDRTLKIVEEVPTEALNNYHLSLPTRTDLQMPVVLKSIKADWTFDESKSDGDNEGSGTMPQGGKSSLTAGVSSSGQARISVTPSLITEIETVFGSDIQATAHFFYYNSGGATMDEGDLINRLSTLIGTSVNTWPVFKPKAHTIITRGASVVASTKAGVSQTKLITIDGQEGETNSKESDFAWSVDRTIDVTQLNPTIHGPISIIDATKYSSIFASSSSSARLTGDFSGSEVQTASASSYVQVSPTSFPATSPSDIPRSGLYVISSKAEPFKWGWVKCSALVIDAGQFA